MKLEDLDFTVRTYNCLRRAGIETVEQLQGLRMLDLLRIRNLGRRSLEEIEEKMITMKLRERQKQPIQPIIVMCEGYQAFRGTMRIAPSSGNTEDITGDWMYKPDTRCWYCRGRSYPVEICTIHQEGNEV